MKIQRFQIGAGAAASSSPGDSAKLARSQKQKPTGLSVSQLAASQGVTKLWTVNDSEPRRTFEANKHVAVPASGMRNYYAWRDQINKGAHPSDAAEHVADMRYEQLKGKNQGQFTIRLSQEHRVLFTVDQANKEVNVKAIGGHQPSG